MIEYLPLENTRQFSNFVCQFVSTENNFSKNNLQEIIAHQKNNSVNRAVLVQVLKEQYSTIELKNEVLANINLLQNENCFSVTTAHQSCLFTGPMYTIYKAISAIKLAEQFKKDFPENDFVPVFYIGSEDHDKAEINHFYLFNKKIEWQNENGGAVGSMQLSGIETVLEELNLLLQNEIKKEELMVLLKSCYAPENTMSSAFRLLLHHLLGKFGLVILDANDARFKQQFVNVMQDDMQNQSAFRLLNEKSWLQNFENEKLQITPREINLFFLEKNIRERIINDENIFVANNSSFSISKNEAEKFVAENAEKLSPNAILRPLYQSTILPDVAFIGGGAEVTYWSQLKTVFDFYKVVFPQIYLRDSALWLDEQAEQKRVKWNFSIQNIFDDVNFLTKKFTEENSELAIDENLAAIKTEILILQNKIVMHDKSMEGFIAATFTQIENQLEQLQKKILQQEKKKNADAIKQIEKWKEKLFPQNHLQERQMNFIELYLKHGIGFIDILMQHFNPSNTNFKIIAP